MGLSSKFRIGQVAGALSSGLGLFAEKKWKEEQEAEERAWQQHLQNIADARAEARSEVDFQRRIALATREETLALQREGRNKQFDATQRDLDRRARRDEFGMRMSAEERARHDDIAMKRREMLQDTLTRIEERYEDQRSNTMINLDADKMAALETQYKEDRDRAIGSYVQSMMMRAQEYPEVDSYSDFRINSRDEIAGLLESEGATYKGADKIADRWMKWMSDPGADEAGAGGGGFKPTGNYQYTDTDGTVVTGPNYSGRKAPGYDTTPPPPTGGAAQVDPTPRTPMPEAGPQTQEPSPGSLNQLFNAEPITNPDGTPKYPANRESLGYKLFDWMQQPTPYGQ